MFLIKAYYLGVQRTPFLFKILLSTSVPVPPLFILTDTSFDAFHWLLQKMIFSLVQCCIVQERPKIISSSQLKFNKANSVWGHLILSNVFQLKHIQLTKHMHYCIQKIYHVYYTKQWNFIILRKFSHMTLASPNENWMRVADIVRLFFYEGENFASM